MRRSWGSGSGVNHQFGEKPKKMSEASQRLGEEVADLIFAAVCLLNSQGLDLQSELEEVVMKCAHRDRSRFKSDEGIGS